MKYILYIPFLLCILLLQTAAHAQQKDTIPLGTLHGNVMDSAYDFVLPSATVAIYKATDSSLLRAPLSHPDDKRKRRWVAPLPTANRRARNGSSISSSSSRR